MTEQDEGKRGLLLVGAVKRPITPTIKGRRVFIAGDDPVRQATEIHDELWARALALRLDDVTVVLVALDLLGLSREHVVQARRGLHERGVDVDHLIVTCTRNHAGPDVLGRWSKGFLGSGLNLRYVSFVRRELVEVARLAVEALQPATPYAGRCVLPDPCGAPGTKELTALEFRSDDKVIATVVNYGLAPQIVGEDNTLVSAGFCHWLYGDLEGDNEREQVTLYTCAEATEGRSAIACERSWEEAERVGRELAGAVREVLQDSAPIEVDQLRAQTRPVMLPASDIVSRWLRQVRVSGDGSSRPLVSEIGLIDLGAVRLAALPGLPAPEIGDQVRKMLDAPYRLVMGVSNDDLGFIPPQGTSDTPTGRTSHLGTLILDNLDRLLLSPGRNSGNGSSLHHEEDDDEALPATDSQQALRSIP